MLRAKIEFNGQSQEIDLSVALRPYTYGSSGIAEQALEIGQENIECFGRLLAVLVEKNILNIGEAKYISGHEFSKIEIIR